MRDAKLYLIDIKESINRILEYTKGIDEIAFSKNNEKIDAVIRNFKIIGEAAKNIPEDIKEKNNNVNWEDIIGMRNILSHEYFGVDLNIVMEDN